MRKIIVRFTETSAEKKPPMVTKGDVVKVLDYHDGKLKSFKALGSPKIDKKGEYAGDGDTILLVNIDGEKMYVSWNGKNWEYIDGAW